MTAGLRSDRELTEEALRTSIRVAVRHLDAWLSGTSAATAETSRCLVWQWVRHEIFARSLVEHILCEEVAGLEHESRVFDLFVQTALGSRPPGSLVSGAEAERRLGLASSK